MKNLDFSDLTVIAAALNLFIEDQRKMLSELGDSAGRRSARVHIEMELDRAERLLQQVNTERYEPA